MSMSAHAPSPWSVAARRLFGVGALLAFGALTACSGETTPEDTATPAVAPAAPAPVSAPAAAPVPAAKKRDEDAPLAGAAALIGRTVPPYPDGMVEIAGSCVPVAGSVRLCDHGLAMIGSGAADGGAAMARFVIASRNTAPDADKPVWEVVDAADAPALEPGYDLQLGGCRLDGKDDGAVVAAIRHGAGDSPAALRWVRRFDVASGKLVEVESARVDCVNPAAGV